MVTSVQMNSFFVGREEHWCLPTDFHCSLFCFLSLSKGFICIISHERAPYPLKFSFCQLSSMLALFKVPPGVLISLIFTWLNIIVKHLFHDHSEKLAVLLIIQLHIVEDICLIWEIALGQKKKKKKGNKRFFKGKFLSIP